MNEVDIRVTTRQSFAAAPTVSPGLSYPSSRVKWTQRVVVDIYGRNGERSASMQKEEEMDIDYLSDVMSEEEEEEDSIFEPPRDPTNPVDLQGAQCTPVTTNPISIPSPLTLSPSCSSFVTPSHSSIMRRFSPIGSWEAITSPLSSGYGSAPRFFSSIGTQTPPATPVFLETRIQLQFSDSQSPQDSGEISHLRLRQRLIQQDNGRTRFYSEGGGPDEATVRRDGHSLPDLVSSGTSFRNRANSAPTRPSVHVEAGRELRRISDEFESQFYPQRVRRRSLYDLFASLWPVENGGQPPRTPRRAEGSRDHNAVGSGGAA